MTVRSPLTLSAVDHVHKPLTGKCAQLLAGLKLFILCHKWRTIKCANKQIKDRETCCHFFWRQKMTRAGILKSHTWTVWCSIFPPSSHLLNAKLKDVPFRLK